MLFALYIRILFLIVLFFMGGGMRVWFASFASFRIVCVCVSVSVCQSVRVCLSVYLFGFVCVCVRVWNFVKWERGLFLLILRELAYDQIKCILQLW